MVDGPVPAGGVAGIAGQFKALDVFLGEFFLTPGGTALQLRLGLARE